MKLSLYLFYLLLLFIPTQLARHFFFDFTNISGIQSDYLTPTIYFTDIIILLLISTEWSKRLKEKISSKLETRNSKQYQNSNTQYQKPFRISDLGSRIFLLVICFLLFNALIIASNKWSAFYKFIKIIELILLGGAISKLKPKFNVTVFVLSVSVVYSSIIALWQFFIQKSIGGFFWFLGERTFYAGTPGIATISLPPHGLLLRSYATFPHPNVLGGFLAVILPLIFIYSSSDPPAGGESRSLISNNSRQAQTIKRVWFIICLVLGLTALILSFSRVSWFAFMVGIIFAALEKKYRFLQKIKTQKKLILSILYLLITLSIIMPLILPTTIFLKSQYWQERIVLIKSTIPMVWANLPFGVGLNNSIVQLKNYINNFPGLFIFQPVHNIYLLVLSETGIIGLFIFLMLVSMIIHRVLKKGSIFVYCLVPLFILGLFDHYLVTLQQGQLILIIFTALNFLPKVAY